MFDTWQMGNERAQSDDLTHGFEGCANLLGAPLGSIEQVMLPEPER